LKNKKQKQKFTFTITNLNFYQKLSGRKQVPFAGVANETNENWKHEVSRFIRGNFFIPDARRGWNKYALSAGKQIIEQQSIKTIITSSPPHSTQLIGLKLKEQYDINWIADLRDPWTDIYYYDKMNHTRIAKKIDASYEKNVLDNADNILVVSDFIKQQFAKKSSNNILNKITIIPNGFDEKNFNKSNLDTFEKNEKFVISYNGTIASNYSIDAFVDGLKKLIKKEGQLNFKLQFTGSVDSTTKNKLIETFNDLVKFNSHVSHLESIEILKKSDLLLLSIPNIKNNEGILTGKLFEYLASQKPILCIGPTNGDAAKIISECYAGATIDNKDFELAYQFLSENYNLWKSNSTTNLKSSNYLLYSRKTQAKQISNLME
jgi:glycosyltransferase involved in cell wall biosynthesis